jgi:hypothetical protein
LLVEQLSNAHPEKVMNNKNFIRKYLKSILYTPFLVMPLLTTSSANAASCASLLGALQGPLPEGVVSATVTYADNRQPSFIAGPTFEQPNGSPTQYCFVIVAIDADASDPSVIKLDMVLPPDVLNPSLPPVALWNKKFLMAGQGGFAGARNAFSLTGSSMRGANVPIPRDRGYVVSTTDTGHVGGGSGSWALIDEPGVNNEPEINYAYRGVHLATVVGKKITEQFYSQPIKYAYFSGFSNGGRQGAMEAARYPTDYDGIICGAPVQNVSGAVAHFAKITQLQFPDPNALVPLLQTADYNLISQRVLQVCDGVDGVVDGLIRDPRECQFNIDDKLPELTTAQRDVLKQVVGDINLSNHVSDKGREISKLPGEWNAWMGNLNVQGSLYFFALDSIRYFIADDVTATVQNFPVNKKNFQLLEPLDVPRDLKGFYKNGGKLLLYHGWDDLALSPRETIEFYKEVSKDFKNKDRDDQIRLFMWPGYGHAVHNYNSGSGNWDILTEMEKWVEQGIAPDKIKTVDATGQIIRPLCPYPQIATRIDANLPDPNYANYQCVDGKK